MSSNPPLVLDYHIDTARNFVVTRAVGRVAVAEVANHIIRLMRDPEFKPELNALIVVADVNAVPGPVGVGALTPLLRAWSKRRAGVKWAFVLPNRTTREFVESAIEQARLTAVTTRCFVSETAAVAWLEPVPNAAVESVQRSAGDSRPNAVA